MSIAHKPIKNKNNSQAMSLKCDTRNIRKFDKYNMGYRGLNDNNKLVSITDMTQYPNEFTDIYDHVPRGTDSH